MGPLRTGEGGFRSWRVRIHLIRIKGGRPFIGAPLASLAEGDYVYIRNEGDGYEELFNRRDDPNELDNQRRFQRDTRDQRSASGASRPDESWSLG